MENTLFLNGQPFQMLRICFFKVYDQHHEKNFLDLSDEQILTYITKHYHETAHIVRIEDVVVLKVIPVMPKKSKLLASELKSGITEEERKAFAAKVQALREKHS